MLTVTHSAAETETAGRALAERLEKQGITRAFIALYGEMGVGKTAFTRGFAAHFGVSCVKSPTYTIVNDYSGRARIFHFDMYRIDSPDDLFSIGYDDYVNSDGYCISEWSENIESELPFGAISVRISKTDKDEQERKIEIEFGV